MNRSICILAITVLFLSACGQGRDTAQFEQYVQTFEQAGTKALGLPVQVKSIKIYMASVDSGRDAECVTRFGTIPEVRVNIKTWNLLEDPEKERVILHELGHCVLNRIHDDRKGDTRAYNSIMYSNASVVWDYPLNKQAYLNELFEGMEK